MPEKKEDYGVVSYIMGIVSIVSAFFTPLAGLIFGIVGMNLAKRQSTGMAAKGRKLSQIGLVISIIVLIVTVIIAIVASTNPYTANNFPVG